MSQQTTTSPQYRGTGEQTSPDEGHTLSAWRDALLAYTRAGLDLVTAEARLAVRTLAAIQVLIVLAAGTALSTWLAICAALGYWLLSALPVVAVLLIIAGANLLLFAACLVAGRRLLKGMDFRLSRRHFLNEGTQ